MQSFLNQKYMKIPTLKLNFNPAQFHVLHVLTMRSKVIDSNEHKIRSDKHFPNEYYQSKSHVFVKYYKNICRL